MIGIVIVTQGRLADEFLISLEHVVGTQPNIRALCIGLDDDMEACLSNIKDCVKESDEGEGVVILVDMFGATISSDLVFSIMADFNVEVLSGVNLPMLTKLVNARNTESLPQAAVSAMESGRKYINIASQLLSEAK